MEVKLNENYEDNDFLWAIKELNRLDESIQKFHWINEEKFDKHYRADPTVNPESSGEHGHVYVNFKDLVLGYKNHFLAYPGITDFNDTTKAFTKEKYKEEAILLASETATPLASTTNTGIKEFSGCSKVKYDSNYIYKFRLRSKIINKHYLSKQIYDAIIENFGDQQFIDVVIYRAKDNAIVTFYPATIDKFIELKNACEENNTIVSTPEHYLEQKLVILDTLELNTLNGKMDKVLTAITKNKLGCCMASLVAVNHTNLVRDAETNKRDNMHSAKVLVVDGVSGKSAVSDRTITSKNVKYSPTVATVQGDAMDKAYHLYMGFKGITFRTSYTNNFVACWVNDLHEALDFIHSIPVKEKLIFHGFVDSEDKDLKFNPYVKAVDILCRNIENNPIWDKQSETSKVKNDTEVKV